MVLLIFTYLYFWWMVIKASAHKHVSREKVTNRKLAGSLAHAKRKGNTHRFLIQITTKGGALSVVQRGIDNVLAGVARYPVLQKVVWVEIITEDAADPSASDMLIELLRRAGDDPELLAVVGRTANVLREGLAALISRGITEGAIDPDLDATETAAWLQAIVDATYLNARPGHSPHIELHRTVLGYLNPPQGRQEEPNG